MKPILILLLLATAALADNECTYTTSVVARSKEQHTGIAWAPHQGGKWSNGRLFVTYPYYSLHDHRISVAEVVPRECRAGEEPGKGATGCVDFLPFPSALINRPLTPAGLDHIYRNMHQGRAAPDLSGALINVRSIWCDRYGSLWILDNANVLAARGGAISGEAKLIQVDVSGVPMPGKERVVRQIKLASSLTPRDSSLNDLRVDLSRSVAYITDSGLPGIIVLDLNTGKAVRRLATHPSTHAELTEFDVAGRPQEVVGHVDGIANDVRRDVVYFQALSSRTLYAVSGSMLRDTSVSEAELGNAVRVVASEADGWTTGDGLAIDEQGRVYQTSLEKSAIRRVDPNASTLTHPEHLRGSGSGGVKVETLAAEEELLGWPDSMGMVATGRFPGTYSGDAFYVTNSGLHFGRGARNPVEGGWPILQVKKDCKAAVELQ